MSQKGALKSVGLTVTPGSAPQRVGEIDLAALQHREARGLVGDDLEREPLHARGLPPEQLVRFEHELDAWVEGDEPVWSGADRRLLEPVVTDLLEVLLRHDPRRAGRRRRVEREKVRPRVSQHEPYALRIHDLHVADLVLQQLRGRAAIALERELHVVRCDRLPVVELGAFAQHELVHAPVR